MVKHSGLFKKGNKGGPGRPPILLPEVQQAIEQNRNSVKTLIIQKFEGQLGPWIDRIIEQGIGEGDVARFKMLLELALGKMVDDAPDFPLSDEEKLLILEYRKRKKALLERAHAEHD